MQRTKALEVLAANNVSYELKEFAATEFTAEEVAAKLSLPLSAVFKTLLVRGANSGELLAVVPGDRELSLRKLAGALKDKKVDLVPVSELQRLTGCLKGGVSPFGTKKKFRVIIDSTVREHDAVSISAGLRGLQVLISPGDLIRVCAAELADLT